MGMSMAVASRALQNFMDNAKFYATSHVKLIFIDAAASDVLDNIENNWAHHNCYDEWDKKICEAPTYNDLHRRIMLLDSLGIKVFWTFHAEDQDDDFVEEICHRRGQLWMRCQID